MSARACKVLLDKVRPRDVAGEPRHRVAAGLIADRERVYARQKAAMRSYAKWLLARVMRAAGVQGVTRIKRVRTTKPDPGPHCMKCPRWPGHLN